VHPRPPAPPAPADTTPKTANIYLVFNCPRFRKERRELIGVASAWEDLDAPVWVKEGDDEPYDNPHYLSLFGPKMTEICPSPGDGPFPSETFYKSCSMNTYRKYPGYERAVYIFLGDLKVGRVQRR